VSKKKKRQKQIGSIPDHWEGFLQAICTPGVASCTPVLLIVLSPQRSGLEFVGPAGTLERSRLAALLEESLREMREGTPLQVFPNHHNEEN
jgi:hypothetical protein